MFASLSRGSSRAKNSYICSSCLSNTLAHQNFQSPRIPPNHAIQQSASGIPFSTTSCKSQSEGKQDIDIADAAPTFSISRVQHEVKPKSSFSHWDLVQLQTDLANASPSPPKRGNSNIGDNGGKKESSKPASGGTATSPAAVGKYSPEAPKTYSERNKRRTWPIREKTAYLRVDLLGDNAKVSKVAEPKDTDMVIEEAPLKKGEKGRAPRRVQIKRTRLKAMEEASTKTAVLNPPEAVTEIPSEAPSEPSTKTSKKTASKVKSKTALLIPPETHPATPSESISETFPKASITRASKKAASKVKAKKVLLNPSKTLSETPSETSETYSQNSSKTSKKATLKPKSKTTSTNGRIKSAKEIPLSKELIVDKINEFGDASFRDALIKLAQNKSLPKEIQAKGKKIRVPAPESGDGKLSLDDQSEKLKKLREAVTSILATNINSPESTKDYQADTLEKLMASMPPLAEKRARKKPSRHSLKEAMQGKPSLRKRTASSAKRPVTVRYSKISSGEALIQSALLKPVKFTGVRRIGSSAEETERKLHKKEITAHEIKSINAESLELLPVNKEQPPVPSLAYGLERVLFNPGVYHLQDPRSRVFNFDPYLREIMPVTEFDFTLLKRFITSSRDETLLATAKAEKRKYTGSTSSMTSALSHFHYLLSQWRPINTGALSKNFPAGLETFTAFQRIPCGIFLRWKDGVYAIDADKEFDTANVLSMLGQSMEKLLTLSTDDFEKYRKSSSETVPEEERSKSESYHYTTMGDFLMRSQLDAYDPRIPGTGMFDLKTRAVVSIRMDVKEFEEHKGYEIRSRHGEWESFEREYYDMIRAAFLKYSLQVRMGRMDGIFVAFHNTERIFGFQYISLSEMDYALHGTEDTTLGDSEFKVSLEMMNRVLDRATTKYPEQSLQIYFETRGNKDTTPFMYAFARPITEETIEKLQTRNKAVIEKFEKEVLGLHHGTEEEKEAEWESLQAQVEKSMEDDENGVADMEDDEAASDGKSHAWDFDSVEGKEEDLVEDLEEALEEEVEFEESVEEEDHLPMNAVKGIESDHIIDEDSLEHDQETEIEEDEEPNEPDALDVETPAGAVENGIAETGTEGLESENTTEIEGVEDAVESESEEPVENDESIYAREEEQADGTSASSNQNNSSQTKQTDSTKANESILGMYLTIRNKVNGNYTVRPEKITASDEWDVEYALAEIKDPEKAQRLFKASKERRQLMLTHSRAYGEDDARNNQYIENIKKLSDNGKSWRAHLEKVESEEPLKVLDSAVWRKDTRNRDRTFSENLR